MGYRSDVLLAVALPTELAGTLIAGYMIQPGVQDEGTLNGWCRTDWPDLGATVIWASFAGVKWYQSYSDVMAYERMFELCGELADVEGSKFYALTRFLRIGENEGDIESSDNDHLFDVGASPDNVDALRQLLWDVFSLRREICIDAVGKPLVDE